MERSEQGWVMWVGRACWPYPLVLARDGGRDRRLMERSIFLDPADDAQRLWLVELGLRCPAVCAVVADGRRMQMAATRRLQLAAQQHGAVALLARPEEERRELSAAATRWLVRHAADPRRFGRPRWTVELVRCKGGPNVLTLPQEGRWALEWDHAAGAVVISADLADRPGQEAAGTGRQVIGRTA